VVQTSAHPLRFNTGDTTVDACLLRLEALAAQPCQSIEDGVSIEEWIEDVLREMRALPTTSCAVSSLKRSTPGTARASGLLLKWSPGTQPLQRHCGSV
jgi:hypothetical protein